MVTQVPSFSLGSLPFLTCGFRFTVQDSSGATAIITTFRHQEAGGVGSERLTSSLKDISQELHDAFLFTTHGAALGHLATSGSKKLRNGNFMPDNYALRHTSGVVLLRKKGRRYIQKTLAVSTTWCRHEFN